MFKRNDTEDAREEPTMNPKAPAASPPPAAAPKPAPSSGNGATIGPSIHIKGDMAGKEDVLVQGRVEGTISLPDNLLTIGKEGQINATVTARVINVEGRVEGDLNGQEQVVLKRSGNVQGNIVAPRVTLEDGCHFKGSIDMDAASGERRGGATFGNVADLKTAAGSEDLSGKATKS